MNPGLKDFSHPDFRSALGWVIFNGTKDRKNVTSTSNTDRLILATEGVERVERINTGQWKIHCGFAAKQYLSAHVTAKNTTGNLPLTCVSTADTGLLDAKRVSTHLIDTGATAVAAYDPEEVLVVLFGQ